MKSTMIVFLGGGIGSVARHFVNVFIVGLTGTAFPWGILSINVMGSTAMGLVTGWLAFKAAAPAELRLFLATGILGGFTTFSAFSLDASLLYERGEIWLAIAYVVASVSIAICGLFLGLFAMRSLIS